MDTSLYISIFYTSTRRPPSSTLFPYTTLFRSIDHVAKSLDKIATTVGRLSDGFSAIRVNATNRDRSQRRERRSINATQARSLDRKSTRLNSSHTVISYAVFCLKKKKKTHTKNK